MADTSATIIAASLDSDALEESINKLVETVATKTKAMADNFTSKIARMEQAVRNLGNVKVNSSSSADGGSSRRTSTLKSEEEQTKKVVAGYDAIAAANNRAAQSASTFIQNEREQLRMRQHEIEARLKEIQSKYGNVEVRAIVRNDGTFGRAIDNIKQKIQEARQKLQEVPPTSALGRQFSQELQNARVEYNELLKSRRAFESQSQIASLTAEYQQNNQKIKELASAYAHATTGEKQLESSINSGASAIERYGNSAEKAYQKMMKLSFDRAINIPTKDADLAAAKLERLQSILADHRFLGALSPSQVARARKEVDNLEQALNTITTKQEHTTQSAHQYTEEIRRQAQAIRESVQWQEKGYAIVNGVNVYNLEKDTTPLKSRISLEEQLLQLHKSEEASMMQQAAGEEKVAQATRLTEEELNRVYQGQKKVNEEISKRASGIRAGGTTPFQSYDNLRQSIAAVLGIQEQQVKMADIEKDSYNRLSLSLKQLKQAYDSLSRSDRESEKGKELIVQIQILEREIQKLRAQASRPISLLDVKELNEKTLDDIAYKMRQLSSYRSGLNVDTQKKEISTVNAEYDRLKKKMDEVMQKNQQMIGSNNALGRSWNYMKNRLAFYFTVGASTSFIKNLIEVRSQYEMNERALGILIGSAERGTQVFSELSQMALVSPYTLIELSNAAKQLTAYDIAAKDVVETTRRLADMASAVGVPMERLTYALGQIKAYGYLNSRDARMFANAGIPLVRELSKYYSELEGKVVSVGDVYTRMKKKAIEYNDVMAVVTKMTDEGGKFFDFQAKMADTLKVQLANLTLAWNNMLNDLGASQQGVLVGGIAALKNLFLHWQDIYDIIKKVAYAFGLYKLAQATTLIWTGRITTAMGMQELVGKKLQARLAGLTAANKSFVAASTMGWMALAAVVVEVLYTWHRNVEEIERLNKTIADGAKESAKALDEFINSAEMSYARLSAQTGKLPKSEAEKTWDALREQIEISSASADKIIPKLLEIGDLNQRLTIAFGLAERIKDANEKLGDLEDSLDVSQDSILGGLLGEGLIEDIEDYNEHLAYSAEKAEYFTKKNHGFWENAAMGLKALYNEVRDSMGSSTDEAEKEITNFARNAAQTIKDELGEEGLKDKIQVNEAIARVVSGVEQMFPKLRGKGKMLFETMFNDVMAQEFNGAVDKQAYYYKLFLDRLKKDHGSAFQGVTDDILKETHRWSSAQENAISKTAEKVKKDLPLASQEAIDQILNQLNNTDFKLRIVTEFATTKLDEVQDQFRDKFINKPWIADQKEREKAETEAQQRYGNLMRKTTESNVEYEKRISDERKKQLELSQKNAEIIAANKNKQDALSKAIVKDAQEQKKASNDWLKAAKEVEDAGGYDFSTKKENTAATKAQHAAETELQKALKDELQLIDKVRSQYKKLTDAGASDGEALAMVTNQFANSLKHVNSVLGKNGIPLFDISKFAGTDNPNALLDMLKLQLDSAKVAKNIKPEEIKELEVKYSEIIVDAKAYNLTKITKGLNNELDRLKEEYELAVALDADPELGSMFADWMGIDMNELPRTAKEYAKEYTDILNKYLKNKKSDIELPNLLDITNDDLRAFQEQADAEIISQEWVDNINKGVKAARDIFKKETSDQIKEWDKLLEKYSEYESKINKIHNDAAKERVTFARQFGSKEEESLAVSLQTQILAATDPQEKQKLIQQLQELVKSIAGDDKTKVNLITSIDNSEQQGVAKGGFEEFQRSPEWIIATGDLAGLTNSALGMLISKLEEYKKKAKNLDPKQIKNLNRALVTLRNQQRKNNPFAKIAIAMEEAKLRADELNPEIEKTKKEIDDLEKNRNQSNISETNKRLEELRKRLKDLEDAKEKLQDTDPTVFVDGINSMISAASEAITMFTNMAEALGGKHMTEAAQTIRDVTGILEKAGQGAAMGAQIGGGWGALIGGVAGGLAGVITTFAEQWSGNKAITNNIKESEKAVRQLELAMKSLEHTSDDAFGAIVVGSKQSIKATKELQLAELRRQLALEQSRSSKYRDEERINELQGQILDLEYEVKHATSEIVNDLLGISSHEDFFEGLISDMINAFKSGEDAMKVFSDKWAEMIDSMVVKMILGQVLQQWVNNLESGATKIVDKYTKKLSEQVAEQENVIQEMQSMDAGDITETLYYTQRDLFDKIIKQLGIKAPDDTNWFTELFWFGEAWENGTAQKIADAYMDMLKNGIGGLQDQISKKSLDATEELIEYYTQEGKVFGDQIKDIWPQLMEQFGYKYGQDADAGLSALQQGIQGITEDTAGAIEAYMNGVSQQVYYQSDILTQIRDILIGGDADIQLGVQGQMLLQLQQSFQVQMAIQGILEGVLTPSGQGFRVELLS